MNTKGYLTFCDISNVCQFLVFILFSTFSLKSQIKIVDQKKNLPIQNVEIFNKNGVLVGLSDNQGIIPSIKPADYPLFISHFLYKETEVNRPISQIELIPKFEILANVSVKATKLKYIILSGYFRGFQTKNDTLDIYADAKINWIVNAKNFKTIGFEILSSRYLKSKKYSAYKLRAGKFGIKLITLPSLQNDLPKYELQSISPTLFVLNYTAKEKEFVFWGNSSRIQLNMDELFTLNREKPFENLVYFNHKHRLKFRQKKSTISDQYEALTEFSPNQIYFSNNLPDKLHKRIVIDEHSNHHSNFWEEIEANPRFKILPPAIIKSIELSMELVD
jgi:hypothetical protein